MIVPVPRRRVLTALIGTGLAGWIALADWNAATLAQDDLDQQLLESLEGRREPDSPETVINRLLDNTQSARERLAAGHFDEPTQSIQQQILDDIDALLRHASSSPPPGRPSPPSEESPGQRSDADGTGSLQGQPGGVAAESAGGEGREPSTDPNAPSRESSERTTAAEEGEAARQQRMGLATAAWGHLPPKVREQMRSAISEEFLPEYDELIRRYYEALATRRRDEQRPTNERVP
jgi:hypothetical protein